MPTLTVNLYDHRPDPKARTWDLPPWGHPIALCALPLFIEGEGRYHPVGTAFWIGPKVQLVVTAMHNISEAFRYEPRFERLLAAGNLPSSIDLKHVG